jgi:hypothetical protein
MLVVGVDPGLTGALALLSSIDGLLDVIDMPTCPNGTASGSMRNWVDVAALLDAMRAWATRFEFARAGRIHCAMERPIPMPTLPAQTVADAIRYRRRGARRPDGAGGRCPHDQPGRVEAHVRPQVGQGCEPRRGVEVVPQCGGVVAAEEKS